MQHDAFFSDELAAEGFGGVQQEVLFSVMKIIHRQAPPTATPTDKAPRLSCCCRLSELLPLVRQLHDEARTVRLAREAGQQQQAA